MAHMPTNDNRAYTILNNYINDKLEATPNRIDAPNNYYAEATITYSGTLKYTTARCIKISDTEYIVYVTKEHKPYTQQYLYADDISALFPVTT